MEGDDLLDGGPDTDWLDGGPDVMGDQCVNGEVLLDCEFGPAQAASKAASRTPKRLRVILTASGGRVP